jgi:hypothetical protein
MANHGNTLSPARQAKKRAHKKTKKSFTERMNKRASARATILSDGKRSTEALDEANKTLLAATKALEDAEPDKKAEKKQGLSAASAAVSAHKTNIAAAKALSDRLDSYKKL